MRPYTAAYLVCISIYPETSFDYHHADSRSGMDMLPQVKNATDVQICSAKDPNLNACFTESGNRMLKHLVNGIRKLNAVPMDPLYVPLISLQRNNSLIPTLAFNVTDSIHEGWKDAVLVLSKIDTKNREFNMVIRLPTYRLRGQYEVTGSIIGIPLEGSGDLDFIYTNVTHNMLIRSYLENRRSKEYLVIEEFHNEMYADKLEITFENLFNNTELTAATNKLMNENNRLVLDESKEVLNQIYGDLHRSLMQRMLDRVPYKAMFTDLD